MGRLDDVGFGRRAMDQWPLSLSGVSLIHIINLTPYINIPISKTIDVGYMQIAICPPCVDILMNCYKRYDAESYPMLGERYVVIGELVLFLGIRASAIPHGKEESVLGS